jgi:hypothetical protein
MLMRAQASQQGRTRSRYTPGESEVRMGKLFDLRSSPRRLHHPLVQTFPVWNVMHGHHEGITKVHFILTEPSQVIRLVIALQLHLFEEAES